MKKLTHWAIALCSAAMLAACGGGGGSDTALVAGADASLEVDATTGRTLVAAMEDETFAYPAGVPALGTGAATNVTFTAPATAGAAPGFSIASGGRTATGTMAFGSCIFRITSSTFPGGHVLANGNTVTVDPCSFTVDTEGKVADGTGTTTTVSLVLGAAESSGTSVTVVINPSGSIVVNGVEVGDVTLEPGTGAS